VAEKEEKNRKMNGNGGEERATGVVFGLEGEADPGRGGRGRDNHAVVVLAYAINFSR
jgi:hypothetical protein